MKNLNSLSITQSQIELEMLLVIAHKYGFKLIDCLSVEDLVEKLLHTIDKSQQLDDFYSVLSYKENELI